MSPKKTYSPPELTNHGTVAEVTLNGVVNTTDGGVGSS